jgi:hypothetical protein
MSQVQKYQKICGQNVWVELSCRWILVDWVGIAPDLDDDVDDDDEVRTSAS